MKRTWGAQPGSGEVMKGLAWSLLALALGACTFQVGDYQIEIGRVRARETPQVHTIERAIPQGDARRAEISLVMAAGDLRVEPGAQALLEAVIQVDEPEREPEIRVTREGDRVRVIMRQPPEDLVGGGGRYNRWQVRLNPEVPTYLSIQVGAGRAQVGLQGMNLTGLGLEMGAGDATVDLRGGWARDIAVSIKRGVGNLTLVLPKRVGVRVSAIAGVGTLTLQGLTRQGDYYVNRAYGDSDITLDIDLLGAVGSVYLRVEE